MNICLIMTYDGTDYYGFQKQRGVLTVQGVLESTLKHLYQVQLKTLPAGRTDKGVHAEGQVVTYEAPHSKIPLHKLPEILNYRLPSDIRILHVSEILQKFHPRYDAKRRWYRYSIRDLSSKKPFSLEMLRYAHEPCMTLNRKRLKAYLKPFLGTHDFRSFASVHDTSRTKVRHMYAIKVKEQKGMIVIDLHANAFLRGMVRAIIGTVLEGYRMNVPPQELRALLQKKNPLLVKHRAPAKGLCLKKVYY